MLSKAELERIRLQAEDREREHEEQKRREEVERRRREAEEAAARERAKWWTCALCSKVNSSTKHSQCSVCGRRRHTTQQTKWDWRQKRFIPKEQGRNTRLSREELSAKEHQDHEDIMHGPLGQKGNETKTSEDLARLPTWVKAKMRRRRKEAQRRVKWDRQIGARLVQAKLGKLAAFGDEEGILKYMDPGISQGTSAGNNPFIKEESLAVNRLDHNHLTPLMYACIHGHEQVCESLLHHKAELGITDNFGRTALMHGSIQGQHRCVAVLLDRAGHSQTQLLNRQDNSGLTCVMCACANGNVEVLRILLSLNADLNIADQYGTTALMWACRNGSAGCVEILGRHFQAQSGWQGDGQGSGQGGGGYQSNLFARSLSPPLSTPLSTLSHPTLATSFVGQGGALYSSSSLSSSSSSSAHSLSQTRPQGPQGQQKTPAAATAASGPMDVDAQDDEGLTALMIAAANGDLACVELLLELCRAYSDMRDRRRRLALDHAQGGGTEGHRRVARRLLAYNASDYRHLVSLRSSLEPIPGAAEYALTLSAQQKARSQTVKQNSRRVREPSVVANMLRHTVDVNKMYGANSSDRGTPLEVKEFASGPPTHVHPPPHALRIAMGKSYGRLLVDSRPHTAHAQL